jgi:hypothetical protein
MGSLAEYKTNMNVVGSVLSTMADDLRNSLLTARTPEGRMLGNTVGFNKWLAQLGREINPTATLVPVNDPDAGKTISTEITDIEMKDARQGRLGVCRSINRNLSIYLFAAVIAGYAVCSGRGVGEGRFADAGPDHRHDLPRRRLPRRARHQLAA